MARTNSQQLFRQVETLPKIIDGEISIYHGETVTNDCLIMQIGRLKTVFPTTKPEFFAILSERVIANGFTEERLKDAVNKLIDNFRYKDLNIADIVGFDKRQKLYTWQEVYKEDGRFPSKNFKEIDNISGTRLFVKITEM